MVRIADRPAALSIPNLHELNRNRSERRLQIAVLPLIANVLAVSVLLLDQVAIGRELSVLAAEFGHFDFVALSGWRMISRRLARAVGE